jgi:2-oxoglutarate/2-oxoacid ferredoxin oxidoreductase subunit alpha
MKTDRILITGNEAAAEAAIRAGCRYYYGYPITPQNELTGYMAAHMPEAGGVFIQAESELAAIAMVYGSAATGKRTMTSSSSPGISLKQEGISYLAGAELPCLIINVMRAGPGLGGIGPAQGDYFQAVKGGGHGDYRMFVLAPHTVQETIELVQDAFDLADMYRSPVMILSDGQLGQMMEAVVFEDRPRRTDLPAKDWALTGADGRAQRIVRSFRLGNDDLIAHNVHLQEKYKRMQKEVRYQEMNTEDADVILVAYGTPARVCMQAIRDHQHGKFKIGLIRPITLWPFPTDIIRQRAEEGKRFVVVEMSAGQMVEDVRLAVEGRTPVGFCGRLGCGVPSTKEVMEAAEAIFSGTGGKKHA